MNLKYRQNLKQYRLDSKKRDFKSKEKNNHSYWEIKTKNMYPKICMYM